MLHNYTCSLRDWVHKVYPNPKDNTVLYAIFVHQEVRRWTEQKHRSTPPSNYHRTTQIFIMSEEEEHNGHTDCLRRGTAVLPAREDVFLASSFSNICAAANPAACKIRPEATSEIVMVSAFQL
jgi:hypothetical protein